MAGGVNSCTLFLMTTSSKSSLGLYCPSFERCGDESVAVSHSYFRTRKTEQSSADPSCLNMMSRSALSVSRNSLKH